MQQNNPTIEGTNWRNIPARFRTGQENEDVELQSTYTVTTNSVTRHAPRNQERQRQGGQVYNEDTNTVIFYFKEDNNSHRVYDTIMGVIRTMREQHTTDSILGVISANGEVSLTPELNARPCELLIYEGRINLTVGMHYGHTILEILPLEQAN